jgi:hypothetical protein
LGDDATAYDFKNFPFNLDALFFEYFARVLGDGFEPARGQCQDGRTRAREADTQQPRMGLGRDLARHFGQTRDLRCSIFRRRFCSR